MPNGSISLLGLKLRPHIELHCTELSSGAASPRNAASYYAGLERGHAGWEE